MKFSEPPKVRIYVRIGTTYACISLTSFVNNLDRIRIYLLPYTNFLLKGWYAFLVHFFVHEISCTYYLESPPVLPSLNLALPSTHTSAPLIFPQAV